MRFIVGNRAANTGNRSGNPFRAAVQRQGNPIARMANPSRRPYAIYPFAPYTIDPFASRGQRGMRASAGPSATCPAMAPYVCTGFPNQCYASPVA